MKWYTLLLVFLAFVFLVLFVNACTHYHKGGHAAMLSGQNQEKLVRHLDKRMERMLRTIDASEEQQVAIRAIAHAIIEDGIEVRQQGSADRVMRIFTDSPDQELLHAQLSERSRDLTEFGHRTLDRVLEINALLTSEQRQKVVEHLEKKHARRGV